MSRPATWRRIDLLILVVAAAAVVLRNDREIAEMYQTWAEGVTNRWPAAWRPAAALILRGESDFLAALVVVTVGLGLGALRRPFVAVGRRWPTRGVAAIAAAGGAVVSGMIGVALEAIADPKSTYHGLANPRFIADSLRSSAGSAASWVLGAWMLLALAGRWRARADGLDQLGRLLGWCWLASIAFDLIRATLW